MHPYCRLSYCSWWAQATQRRVSQSQRWKLRGIHGIAQQGTIFDRATARGTSFQESGLGCPVWLRKFILLRLSAWTGQITDGRHQFFNYNERFHEMVTRLYGFEEDIYTAIKGAASSVYPLVQCSRFIGYLLGFRKFVYTSVRLHSSADICASAMDRATARGSHFFYHPGSLGRRSESLPPMPGVCVYAGGRAFKTSIRIPELGHELSLPQISDLRIEDVSQWLEQVFLPSLDADEPEDDAPARLDKDLRAKPADIDVALCILEFARRKGVFVGADNAESYEHISRSLDLDSRWTGNTVISREARVLAKNRPFGEVRLATPSRFALSLISINSS